MFFFLALKFQFSFWVAKKKAGERNVCVVIGSHLVHGRNDK
jgi:hypothetical protein